MIQNILLLMSLILIFSFMPSYATIIQINNYTWVKSDDEIRCYDISNINNVKQTSSHLCDQLVELKDHEDDTQYCNPGESFLQECTANNSEGNGVINSGTLLQTCDNNGIEYTNSPCLKDFSLAQEE